jgi:hypothetical protein
MIIADLMMHVKKKRIRNLNSCKVGHKSSRGTIYEMETLFCGANEANKNIFRKQIYPCSHILCYQVGRNKTLKTNTAIITSKLYECILSKFNYHLTIVTN